MQQQKELPRSSFASVNHARLLYQFEKL